MSISTIDNYNACVIGADERGIYSVFIVDFANDVAPASTAIDGFIEKRPTFLIKDLSLCFCVLGSILYMFEAPINRDAGPRRKRAFELKLSVPYAGDAELNSHTIKDHQICAMHSPKWSPRAVPTPDGKKILVFSSSLRNYLPEYGIDTYDKENKRKRFDFEVFDTIQKSWVAIPNLVTRADPRAKPNFLAVRDEESGAWIEYQGRKDLAPFLGRESGWSDSNFTIQACFINNSTFIVGFPMGVVFAYNLDQGWKDYTDEWKVRADWSDFLLADDGLRMNPFGISNGSVNQAFLITDSFQKPIDNLTYLITMMEYSEEDSRCCIPCILWSGRCTTSDCPYFICHLFKVDMSMVARPLHLNSFKYTVSESTPYFFFVIEVFRIIMTTESMRKESALLTESRAETT